jgi:hypothetical protein
MNPMTAVLIVVMATIAIVYLIKRRNRLNRHKQQSR